MNAFSEMDRVRRTLDNNKTNRIQKSPLLQRIKGMIFKRSEGRARIKNDRFSRPSRPLENNPLARALPQRKR
ncbi:MAG: hypothetical protein DWQ02_16735 [Bacteroidetes bacterium]|nr:MAG: hypothetical protein DWQ02_16735 [Bacteroidota bacterium]